MKKEKKIAGCPDPDGLCPKLDHPKELENKLNLKRVSNEFEAEQVKTENENITPSSDDLRLSVEEEKEDRKKVIPIDILYLSEEKQKELYIEFLIFLIDLRKGNIDLKNFLKSIRNDAKIRNSLVTELFKLIEVEMNKYKKIQLNVTLHTFIHATLFSPDFKKLSAFLAREFNEHIDTISKMVEETINGFYDVVHIDLGDFSLEDLEKLELSDIFDCIVIEEEVDPYEEKSYGDIYDYIESLFDDKIEEEKESKEKLEVFKEPEKEEDINTPTQSLINNEMKTPISKKAGRTGKALEDHEKDIEPIIKRKRGKIIDRKWEYIGKARRKTPYFKIECEKGHIWWTNKYHLSPSKDHWCPHPNCKYKSLEEHEKDIEPIVKRKGGKIIDRKWEYIGKRKDKTPYFKIEYKCEDCNETHRWWIQKNHLKPDKDHPDGSWYDHRYKTLENHQKDIEPIIKRKGGTIIDSKFKYHGKLKVSYFKIEYECIKCNEIHNWWASKSSLSPSKSNPDGSWYDHRYKTLEDHQKDLEPIIKRKKGKILGKKWEYVGKAKKKRPRFHIKCNKGHDWWTPKSSLMPSKKNPNGTWCRICQNRLIAIGIFAHILLEYFSLKYLNLRRCKAKHEDSLEEGGKPDLNIERDLYFKTNIEPFQEIISFSEKVEFVLVDFTLGLHLDSVLSKCFKNYQDENRFLMIVLLREEGELTVQYFRNLLDSDPDIIKTYRNNIKVINFEEYLSFLNLDSYLKLIDSNGQVDILNFDLWSSSPQNEKEIAVMLLRAVNLSIKAIDNDSALNKLKQLSEKYSKLF